MTTSKSKKLLAALEGPECSAAYGTCAVAWVRRHRLLACPTVLAVSDALVEGVVVSKDIDTWVQKLLKETYEPGVPYIYSYVLAALVVAVEAVAIQGHAGSLAFLRSLTKLDLAEFAGPKAVAKLSMRKVLHEQQAIKATSSVPQ